VPVRRASAVFYDELVGMDRHTVLLGGAHAAAEFDAVAAIDMATRAATSMR